jgi:hypothetical protein
VELHGARHDFMNMYNGVSFYCSSPTYFAVSIVSYHSIFGCGILHVMDLLMSSLSHSRDGHFVV